MNTQNIERLIEAAYQDMTGDDMDHDFVIGCLAEALARIQNDTGAFDNQEGL